MSRFFFSRPAEPDAGVAPEQRADRGDALGGELKALAEVQSITASAIFAVLVSKGVLTAEEAAAHMAEIAAALESDVGSPAAERASTMLRSYGRALSAAGR